MSENVDRIISLARLIVDEMDPYSQDDLICRLAADPGTLSVFRAALQQLSKDDETQLIERQEGPEILAAADALDLLPEDPTKFLSSVELNRANESEYLSLLSSACVYNDWKAVEYLAKRTDVNQLDHNGQMALTYAVGNNSYDCVRVLLENGADPNRRDRSGSTAMHVCAISASSLAVFKLLVSYGGKLNKRDHDGHDVEYYLRETGRANWLR